MAENPLLPHRKLQELRALMLRLRALEGRSTKGPRLEAIKAAALMHIEAGDYAAAPGAEDALPAKTAPKKPGKKATKKAAALAAKPTRDRIATAAGIAQGFKLAKLDRAAIVFTGTATAALSEPGWAEALDYAMRAELALIVVCIDSMSHEAAKDTAALTWPAAEKLSTRNKLPIVSVDGEDAVALYRVMQETMIHVRLGIGPVLIWAVCSDSKLKPSEQPIARLEDYMRVRDIPMTSTTRKTS